MYHYILLMVKSPVTLPYPYKSDLIIENDHVSFQGEIIAVFNQPVSKIIALLKLVR